ncbi:MAG: ATP-dependent DNA helicase RecG, partial [Oscillibacter sp.]|nr:ATP-dependent DNA helicase RecG [Oscillibacter sp.]
MADLNESVLTLDGVGAKTAAALAKLGIETLADLLAWFPRKYEDRREMRRIADLTVGENACVAAMIAEAPRLAHIRRGMDLVKVRAVDETGVLDVTFFNQAWQKNNLKVGQTYVFYGRAEGNLLRRQMTAPVVEPEGRQTLTGRIMPIYPLTAGVSQLMLSRFVRQALERCDKILPDVLPDEVRRENALCRVNFAYENVHFPADEEALSLARRRLAFEELFFFTLGLKRLRSRRDVASRPAFRAADMSPFYRALPFTLTRAQKRCIDEAIADMTKARPMNRLCQGDVGSGKTMVAAACVYFTAQNGAQSALMAPTEILARQHFAGLSKLMEPLGLRCALLTSATPAAEKKKLYAAMEAGEVDLVIGTHALLSEQVRWHELSLVVTDEQHRFGVAQRTALAEKGAHPHTLVMSATPIPRTLALILYGDLDVSVIDELPPGRLPVKTYAVDESYRARLNNFVREQVAQGRQVYIVCPMVEENDELPDERKAVTEYAKRLQQNVFPTLRVASVHGKMKPKEKDAVMSAFVAGQTDILVSTTVIEVGVDVPNASLMIVENAERFGLSQLHQLRGRVGRGSAQSYCVLVSDHSAPETKERLRAMTQTTDGFKIAEEDLRLRGPGDFFGVRQHGLPGLRIAELGCDTPLMKAAQTAAETLLRADPDLKKHPAVEARVQELFRRSA